MADKGYRSATFEAELNDAGITLIRPTVRGEKTHRPLTRFLSHLAQRNQQQPGPARSLIAEDH
jgi:hypothetical protein